MDFRPLIGCLLHFPVAPVIQLVKMSLPGSSILTCRLPYLKGILPKSCASPTCHISYTYWDKNGFVRIFNMILFFFQTIHSCLSDPFIAALCLPSDFRSQEIGHICIWLSERPARMQAKRQGAALLCSGAAQWLVLSLQGRTLSLPEQDV